MSDTPDAHPPGDSSSPPGDDAVTSPSREPRDEPVRPPAPEGGAEELDELSDEVEPTTTGTLFIMIVFLMALAGMWGIMYLMLLER